MGIQDKGDDLKGIIPRAFKHIFGFIDGDSTGKQFLVWCSYLEIYNEAILDLLGDNHDEKHEIKEDPDRGIYVKNLTSVIIKDAIEVEQAMIKGSKNWKTGETKMNKDSSRSHSIFTLFIEMSEKDDKGEDKFRAGKLNLVDLAGSERQSKTEATGDWLKEA